MIAEATLDRPPEPRLDGRRYYRRYLRCSAAEQALSALAWGGGLGNGLLLAVLVLPGETARIALLVLFLAALAVVAGIAWRRFQGRANARAFCSRLESESPQFRDLLNAWELSRAPAREGVSAELRDALIRQVQSRLDRESPERWIRVRDPQSLLKPLALCALSTLLLSVLPPFFGVSAWGRLIFGEGRELAGQVDVQPKGGRVVYGEPAAVTVRLLKSSRPAPRLFVENNGAWEAVEGETSGPQTVFILRSVTEPLRYKVRWRNLESPAYTLTPLEPPRLTDFSVRIVYPAYTGLPDQTSSGEPQIRAIRGARVELAARATRPLERIELVTSDGIRAPVRLEGERKISAVFPVNNPFEFWFEMKDRDGISPAQAVHYPVTIKEDLAPQVRLLAPAADLVAGRESTLPFTYEVRDDWGVQAVFLDLERGSLRRRILLRRYRPAVADKIDSADFDLGGIEVEAGDVLRLRLEAQDNDQVAGPKSGFSDAILIEIQSYEKEHEKTEKELKDFRKDLLDLLAQQTLAKVSPAEWKSLASNPGKLDEKAAQALARQNKINAQAGQIEKNLGGILSRMERDPLGDYSILSEHQALRESLKDLQQGALARAQRSLGEKNAEAAAGEQDRAIAELERLSALSEDVYKYGKMKDLLHAADRLEEKGEALNRKLAGQAELDAKSMQALQDTLRQAMAILMEMQKQIQDLPQELPDDFVNQAAIKQLNLDRMAESAEKLSQALKQKDARSALEAAQDLLKQMKAARDALAKASQDIGPSGRGGLDQQAGQEKDELQKMVDRQEELLQKTDRLESLRKKAKEEFQKKLLAQLAERQGRVIAATQALLQEWGALAPQPPFVPLAAGQMDAARPKMEKVQKEFQSMNVLFSQKWLEEILMHCDGAALGLAPYRIEPSTSEADAARAAWNAAAAAGDGKVARIRSEEQAILDQLKNPPEPPNPFGREDRSELERLGGDQNGLAGEAGKLHKGLAELAGKSALVGQDILDSLKDAQGNMRGAAQSLQQGKSQPAQEQQEKALAALRKGQDGLAQAQEKFGRMKAGGGAPAGFLQPRGGGPGGNSGFEKGSVHIPSADEYLPPRRFREEILDSLKERYPKSQENVIKDYYKRLSQ